MSITRTTRTMSYYYRILVQHSLLTSIITILICFNKCLFTPFCLKQQQQNIKTIIKTTITLEAVVATITTTTTTIVHNHCVLKNKSSYP